MENGKSQLKFKVNDVIPILFDKIPEKQSEIILARIVEANPNKNEQKPYYVHYLNQDTRLDEWVDEERFRPDHPLKSKGSRKIKDEEEPIVRIIEKIEFSKFEIDTWYHSPYPEQTIKNVNKLYICEFCLQYQTNYDYFLTHTSKCRYKHPPGDEIYRQKNLSVFEIDGGKEKIYCQNLCLLAKLFLDHKSLYYDVEPFLFYALCECDEKGAHLVGYFSKEKECTNDYNLACILTLPCFQRKGYGRWMIEFSYALSKVEKKPGTPERPLSDLGYLSYLSFWKDEIIKVIQSHNCQITMADLVKETCMTQNDIVETIKELKFDKFVSVRSRESMEFPSNIIAILHGKIKPRKHVLEENLCFIPYHQKIKYEEICARIQSDANSKQ